MCRCAKLFKPLLLAVILAFPLLLSAQVKNNKQDPIATNDLLKKLIVEALSEKRKKASEDLSTLRNDSTVNAAAIRQLLARVERDNFPMEGTGATLTAMFAAPLMLSDTSAFRDESLARVATLKELKKRKRIGTNIRRNLNIVALADLMAKDQDRINTLLDNLLKNSGQLIANLILGKDSKGQEDVARDIVVDYLNKNLEQLTGAPPVEEEKPLVTEAINSSQQFVATQFAYVNKQLPLSNSATFMKALEDSARKKKTYVFINYSLDASTGAYLARARQTKPVGLPAGTRYKVYTVVNIPGSVEEQVICEGCTSNAGNSEEAIKDDFFNVEEALTTAFEGFLEKAGCPDNDPNCLEREIVKEEMSGWPGLNDLLGGLSQAKQRLVAIIYRKCTELAEKWKPISDCNSKKYIDDDTPFNIGFGFGILDWGCSHKDLFKAETYGALLEFFSEPDLLNQLVEGFKGSAIKIKDESLENDGLLGYHASQSLLAVVELAELVELVKNIPKSAGKIGKLADGVKAKALVQQAGNIAQGLTGVLKTTYDDIIRLVLG
jgi:hypothetical protein